MTEASPASLAGSAPPESATYAPLTLMDAAALREHLDQLNEAGIHPIAVGIDACPQPFLITLVGPYAESEDVFFDSPWQGEVDWQKPARCDDCNAVSHGIEDLRFPVVVLAQADKLGSTDEGRWVVAATEEPWDGSPGVGIKWVEPDA